MQHAQLFLEAMDRKAKMFAPAAGATYEANEQLCSWMLNPLGRCGGAVFHSPQQLIFGGQEVVNVPRARGRYAGTLAV